MTAKQAKFATLVAGGLNLSESYRRAYDAQGMSAGAIRVEAHRLSRHPKIVSAVKALRQGCPKTKRQIAEASKDWVEETKRKSATDITIRMLFLIQLSR